MKALLLNAPLKTASVHTNVPLRSPQQPGELLIRVEAVALNPVDALYTFHPLGASGRTVGTDFAGTVVSKFDSPDNKDDDEDGGIQIGQRVAGFLQGACSVNERPGAFAEYLVCPADLVWRVPEGMDLEKAAAVSLCGLTAAQGLFYRLGLESPFPFGEGQGQSAAGEEGDVRVEKREKEKETLRFLIYGASTSVGMYAAQLVRRSCEVSGQRLVLIAAASRGRWDMLRAAPYGYDALVDYRDPDWPAQTVKLVASTLREEGKMAVVRSRQGGAWAATREELRTEPIYGAVWEGLGVEIQYQGFVVPASEKARRFAVAFYKWLSEGGRLEANPIRLMPGGLDRIVPDGFSLLGSGTTETRQQNRTEDWMKPISAEKLVYRVRG
ncbi:hypothetical protein C8A03DRAFT_41359 [Achaetomium macrosporum]|uniref:Enoyl reductase (ER) domain-containing protein n=1 Tax=Achaetomium macrosporum TaxID=79813 RepID=A0AAN7HHW5_9PEZI|nr:hypothetical protein C8A03DRAFT_41359 [Achaetomium macrosporum]